MAEPQTQDYDIVTEDGRTYTITNATPKQVEEIAAQIKASIDAGDVELTKTKLPHNAQVNRLPSPEIPQVPSDAAFEVDRSVKPDEFTTFFTKLASSIPLNFGDEIASFANAAIPGSAAWDNSTGNYGHQTYGGIGSDVGFWDAFKSNQAAMQNAMNVGAELNPKSAVAGELGGALIGAKGLGMAGRAALNAGAKVAPNIVLPRVAAYEAQAIAHPVRTAAATAGGAGTTGGYVAGFGAGDTMENRLRGGGQGAIAGGTLGTGLGLVTAKVAPTLVRYWNAFRNQGSEDEALQQMVGQLQRDGYDVSSPAGVLALKTELSQFSSKPVTIADIGRYTRGRVTEAINAPSDAQRQGVDFAMERRAGQSPRLQQDVVENVMPNMPLGPNPLNVYSHADDLVASRAGNVDELKPQALYEATVTPPVVPVYEPPVPAPPPLRPFEEPPPQFADNGPPITDPAVGPLVPPGWQAQLDLLPPAAPPIPAAVPPVRTARNTGGVEATLGRGPAPGAGANPTPTRRFSEGPAAGLERTLGPSATGKAPTGADFAAAINAPEQAAIAREAQAAVEAEARAAAEAAAAAEAKAAASAARQTRLTELRAMDADKRAARMAEDDRIAKESAFFENAEQMEFPFQPPQRVRGRDEFGPPSPTFNPKTPRMVTDPTLNRLFAEDPMAQSALNAAIKLSQGERARRLILGQDASDVPEMLAGQPLDYRTADYIKRFLDKEVNSLYTRGISDTYSAAQATQVKELRDAIRERLRAGNKEYANYLDQYADDTELLKALEEGQQFQGQAAEQIAAGQAARKPAARELFQVGAARSLVDDLKGTPDKGVAANRILGSQESREQLEALGLPQGNAEALNTAVRQELSMDQLAAGIKPELAPPETPGALSRAGDIYNPSSPVSWARAIGRGIADTVLASRNAKVNESIIQRFVTADKVAQAETIRLLEAAGKKKAADNLRRVLKARSQGVKGGLIIGSPVSLQEEEY